MPRMLIALAFAELAVQRDARHALQRFGQVLVRELANVLGGDRVENAFGLALGLERRAVARANAVTMTSSSSAARDRLRDRVVPNSASTADPINVDVLFMCSGPPWPAWPAPRRRCMSVATRFLPGSALAARAQ